MQVATKTASPGQLVLMLYDGAIRFLEGTLRGFGLDDPAESNATINDNVQRAQAILDELNAALNMGAGGEFAEKLRSRRTEVFIRLAKSYAGLSSLWSFKRPSVVDGVTLFELLMPPQLRCDFSALKIPFSAVAVDYYAMEPVVLEHGAVIPAIAASSALPTILKPVTIAGRVLVDGGFANPTPWDVVQARTDVAIAVDVTGQTDLGSTDALPSTLDAWVGCTQILFHAVLQIGRAHV